MSLSVLVLLLARPQQAPEFEIPFRVTEEAMIVDATVNQAHVSLMMDTGFSGTVILREGIDVGKPTGEEKLRDFVGTFSAATVPLKSLELGGHAMKVDDAVIVQQPMRNMSVSYNTHVDGILGLGALVARPFEINFQSRLLRFFPSSMKLAMQAPTSSVTICNLLPIGQAQLELPVDVGNGQKRTMGLDTGNAFYATTHRDVLERVGLWSPDNKPRYMRLSGVASGAVDSWSARLKSVKIFDVPVADSVWDIIDRPSSAAEADGTIGFRFLKNFNITVDFANRMVRLQNFTGQVAEAVHGDVGFVAAYSPTLRRMTVLNVSPETPAETAGVQEGDELLSINGRDLAHENYIQMRHILEGPPDSNVKIALSRGGNLMRLDLKRRVLVNEISSR